MAVYVTDFRAWAEEWCKQFQKDKRNNENLFSSITVISHDGKRSCYTVVGDAKTGKIAGARRRAGEKHDGKIGIGVAYARYLGVEIPVERKAVPLQTLKNGEHFVTVDSHDKGVYIGKDDSKTQHIWRCFCDESYSFLRGSCGNMLVYKE